MLSPADVKFYQDQGYLVVPDVLDAATLAAIRADLARILTEPGDYIVVPKPVYQHLTRAAELAPRAHSSFPLVLERKVAVLANLPFGHASLFRQVRNRALPSWAADIDVATWGQYLLKYVISHPAVTCAIPGSTTVSHLVDNQGAGRGRLPDAAMRRKMEEYWDAKP